MCGIVGYVGDRKCRDFILDGLTKLEYRGYDSAGIVCVDAKHKHLSFQKEVGGVALLQKLAQSVTFDGTTGIGHTRWATHGIVDKKNAHPHFNCTKSIAIVHNGIIEGFESLRDELVKNGHVFTSSTDTEVVAHLFSSLFNNELTQAAHTSESALKGALMKLARKLDGAFAFAIVMENYPDRLILLRRRSPLAIGIGTNEMFVASDFLAFSNQTSEVLFLPENSFALVHKNSIELYDFEGNTLPVASQHLDHKYLETDKEGFEHYMLKEIYEQKKAITRTISFCKIIGSNTQEKGSLPYFNHSLENEYNDSIWRQLGLTTQQVKKLRYINLVAAGTSWHAARIAQFFFESICKIPTRIYLASEFRYMPFFPESNSIFIMISQSGETADTLQALRLINSFDIPTIGLTNVASSTIVREAGGFLPMQAGPEISVASTKAFSTQLATLYWLANRIGLEKEFIDWNSMHKAEEDLFIAAEILENTIETYKYTITQGLAKFYASFERFIFLGRHISYPFAMEAALKLKEISYIFSQCYPAGELKHGPIALVDEKTPIVLFSSLDEIIYLKILSNAQEVKARKGHLLVFAFEDQHELINLADNCFIIPKVTPLLAPLAMTGLMQFLIYQITRELNRPIDKPRNLAKSVTVE